MTDTLPGLLVFCRVLLAATLGMAAIAKLTSSRALRGSRRALADLGLSSTAATFVASLLPLAELCTTIALLSHTYSVAGTVSSAILSLCFIAVLARRISLGIAESCPCFGWFGDSMPYVALLRAEALAALALLILWLGWGNVGSSASDWLLSLPVLRRAASLVGVAAIVAGLTIAPWCLSRASRGQVPHQISTLLGPSAGAVIGTVASVQVTRAPERVAPGGALVLFVDSGSEGSQRALASIRERYHLSPTEMTTIDVSHLENRGIAAAFNVTAVPAAVFMNSDLKIGSRLAVGPAAIGDLVTEFGHTFTAAESHRTSTRSSLQPIAPSVGPVTVNCQLCGW